MCVNAETSISAFVVGSFFNFLVAKSTSNVNYLMIAGVYEFALIMQLFDFIAWKDPECKSYNKIATKGAFVFNILQPIVFIIILLIFSQVESKISKIIVGCLLLFYTGFIIYKIYYSTETPIDCLKPSINCKNLYYKWWKNIGDYGIIAYTIPIIISILLLVKSFKFSLIHSIYFIITLLISNKYYSCGTASMWCLFATGGPILNYLLLKSNIV
jgi:hypothetical protein